MQHHLPPTIAAAALPTPPLPLWPRLAVRCPPSPSVQPSVEARPGRAGVRARAHRRPGRAAAASPPPPPVDSTRMDSMAAVSAAAAFGQRRRRRRCRGLRATRGQGWGKGEGACLAARLAILRLRIAIAPHAPFTRCLPPTSLPCMMTCILSLGAPVTEVSTACH